MSEHNPAAPAQAPRQSRTGLTSTGARKAAAKSGRTRAREFVLQALYQHLVGGNSAESIDAFTRDLSGFHKADAAHYNAVLHGCGWIWRTPCGRRCWSGRCAFGAGGVRRGWCRS